MQWKRLLIPTCSKRAIVHYRVGRVLSFFFSRRNWDYPTPHSHAEEGVWESQFRREDIHCGTLYIYVLCDVHRTNNGLTHELGHTLGRQTLKDVAIRAVFERLILSWSVLNFKLED